MKRNILVKGIFSFVLFFLFQLETYGQYGYHQKFNFSGTTQIKELIPLAGKNYLICGTLIGSGVFISKVDSLGNVFWVKSVSFPTETYPSTFRKCNDGGIIMSGYNRDAGFQNNMLMAKFDSSGNAQWARTFGGSGSDIAYDAIQTADGGFAMVGSYQASSQQVRQALIKTNGSGVVQWKASYADTGSFSITSPNSVCETNGNFVIAGLHNRLTGSNMDGSLLKVGTNGNLVWGKSFGYGDFDDFRQVKALTDGSLLVAGFMDTIPGSGNVRDAMLAKFNSNGTLSWAKTFGGSNDDLGFLAGTTTDGGYYLAGTSTSFTAGGPFYYLVKTNASGVAQWTATYGSTAEQGLGSCIQTSDNGFLLGGYTMGFGSFSPQAYIVKTNSSGVSGCFEGLRNSNLATLNLPLTSNAWTYYSDAGTDAAVTATVTSLSGSGGQICFWSNVDELETPFAVQLFPNPADQSVHLRWENTLGRSRIELFDVYGRSLYAETIEGNECTIDLSAMAKGNYFVRLTNRDKTEVKKLFRN